MSISLDNIDELRVRANVGYKEAKEALTQTEGDMVEALIYLEENYGVKSPKQGGSAGIHVDLGKTKEKFKDNENVKSFKAGVKGFMKKKFIVTKDKKTYLNIPLFIAVLLVIISEGFGLLLLGIGYFTGFKYSFDETSTCCQTSTEDVVQKDKENL